MFSHDTFPLARIYFINKFISEKATLKQLLPALMLRKYILVFVGTFKRLMLKQRTRLFRVGKLTPSSKTDSDLTVLCFRTSDGLRHDFLIINLTVTPDALQIHCTESSKQ